jgi:hypothetical protein
MNKKNFFTQNRLQVVNLGQTISDQNTIFNCSLCLGLILKVYQLLFTNTKRSHLSLVCNAFWEFLAFFFYHVYCYSKYLNIFAYRNPKYKRKLIKTFLHFEKCFWIMFKLFFIYRTTVITCRISGQTTTSLGKHLG